MAMLPGTSRSYSARNDAKLATAGCSELMNPMQFGPTSENPASRQMAVSRACRTAPSPPTSANPPAQMTPLRTPAAAADWMRSGARAARTARIASSGTTGAAVNSG